MTCATPGVTVWGHCVTVLLFEVTASASASAHQLVLICSSSHQQHPDMIFVNKFTRPQFWKQEVYAKTAKIATLANLRQRIANALKLPNSRQKSVNCTFCVKVA